MRKGKFIVLEGTDGSGKTTQFKKLVKRLKKERVQVATFDFPQYGKPSSYFVKEYLNGRYGDLKEVNPLTASLFYALDRFHVAPEIHRALEEGKTVVINRYVASNLGHQGSKFSDPQKQKEYFRWDMQLEFDILDIPKPDLNIILHVPPAIAQRLVDKKVKRQYLGGKKRDLHETDLGHLVRTEKTYRRLLKLFPEKFQLVGCVERGRLLSVPEIHEKVWEIVRRRLKL